LGVNPGSGWVDVPRVMDAIVPCRFAGDLGDLAVALADPVILMNRRGELRWGNVAAERLFGIALADGVGRNMLEFMHPDDAELALVSVMAMERKEVGTLLEVRIRGVDGWRLVEARGTSFGDDLLLTVRDITDRRRWEVANDRLAGFRALIQYGASITMVLEPAGEIRSSSAVVTRLLGHDQERLEGEPFASIVDRGDQAALATAWRAATVPSARPVTVDLRLLRRGGGVVPFALTFTNLLDDPTLFGIVATGHDISDRVVAEEELRESNSLLATTLESTADAILVVDQTGQISSYNRRFAEMWRIPERVSVSRDDNQTWAWVLDQLVDPDAFVTKEQELSVAPDVQSRDVVKFKDGRMFERDSRPRRLDDVVVGRVWSFRDITEPERLRQQLVHQAQHDSLTGLANQSLFRDRIDHAVARLDRTEHQVAVLFVDLDDFKYVNDTLGHWAGDALLAQFSERLASQLRVADTAARVGGDEFAVLIDDLTDRNDALVVAQRIIDALHEPVTIDARHLTLTASIGIAYGDKASDTDELLRNADLAMYNAKAQGKNCRRVFTPEMHASALEQLEVLSTD
jgi:diguanylate cyclase (GGDEF)-like protein/PAS domain S-box-containing protein